MKKIIIIFQIVLLAISCSKSSFIQEKSIAVFPKTSPRIIQKKCTTKAFGEQYLFWGIQGKSQYYNNKEYFPFVNSQYESSVSGHLRMENETLYYLPKGYGRKDECNQEIKFLSFDANPGDSWNVECLDVIPQGIITFQSKNYDDDLNSDVYHFSIKRLKYAPHISYVSDIYVSKEYGFIQIDLSNPENSERLCSLYLLD